MTATPGRVEAPISGVRLSAYSVPTSTAGVARAESDGTATWDTTGLLIVEVQAEHRTGVGYAYGSAPAALAVARDTLAEHVTGRSALAPGAVWRELVRAVRNAGRPGVCSTAVSAIDIGLHDLQARLLEVSLLRLLGSASDRVMAYGSGGFTDYDDRTLRDQLGAWAERGLRAVKMKIGSDPGDDPRRVRSAREAIGDSVKLFVDANGAYRPQQALGVTLMLADAGVVWFEEPVSSDDLAGMRRVRDRGPAGMDIAAGEYGYTPRYFQAMLAAGAVDVLQADATRCGGVTGYRSAAAQADAAGVPLSAHTSPALHATLGAAFGSVHVEYFHDHAVIEDRFFDGVPTLRDGDLIPDGDAPGLGLRVRRDDVESFLTDTWSTEGWSAVAQS